MKRLGEKLHLLRTQHGYTARQLAEELGVSHTHIIQIEQNGRGPSASFVLKIADFFNISTDRLMRDDLELEG